MKNSPSLCVAVLCLTLLAAQAQPVPQKKIPTDHPINPAGNQAAISALYKARDAIQSRVNELAAESRLLAKGKDEYAASRRRQIDAEMSRLLSKDYFPVPMVNGTSEVAGMMHEISGSGNGLTYYKGWVVDRAIGNDRYMAYPAIVYFVKDRQVIHRVLDGQAVLSSEGWPMPATGALVSSPDLWEATGLEDLPTGIRAMAIRRIPTSEYLSIPVPSTQPTAR